MGTYISFSSFLSFFQLIIMLNDSDNVLERRDLENLIAVISTWKNALKYLSVIEMTVYDNYNGLVLWQRLIETTGPGPPMVYIKEMEYLFS